MSEALLTVSGLRVSFPTSGGMAEALRGVGFEIAAGEAVGLLGESGSGKSATALTIMGLLPGAARILGGTVRFDGRDLLGLDEAALRGVRGGLISIIFQDPLTALNPVIRIGRQLLHVIQAHETLSASQARARALEVLDLVGLPDPARIMRLYPHELSGGMRQRALIGMAIACRPRLLIADEPTTALDVTIQAQIVDLFRQLRRDLGLALLFITHNLNLMAELCDRAMVMYAGAIVEAGAVETLFGQPRHPYTRMLIDCLPRLDDGRRALTVIDGMPPALGSIAAGCRFAPRCPMVTARCRETEPALSGADMHQAACWEAAP